MLRSQTSFLIATLIHFVVLFGVNLQAAQPGPENGGLRMRLTINQPADGKDDERTIKLELINVSDKEVELVAQEFYESTKTFTEYFQASVAFDTFPNVVPDSAQTSGFARKTPPPRHLIKPDDSLSIEWKESGRALKSPDGNLDGHYNLAPTLPSTGLYGIQARITVVTSKGDRLLLVSNQQQLSIGGSKSLPKHATAKVVSTSEEMETLAIDLGSDHGIETGDVFQVHYSLQAAWRVTIRNVSPFRAEGTVEKVFGREGRGTPSFPRKGWTASLRAPD